MEMYFNYGIVIFSVFLFTITFVCTDKLRIYCGSGMGSALFKTAVGSSIGALILFIINGFKFEFSLVSFLVATASAINTLLFTVCALKALDRINLSLYSLFSMIGGMALPFAAGILFFGEDVTVAKCVCFAVICVSLFLVTEKGSKRGGTIYYIAIFVLNGMSGVLVTIYKTYDGGNVSSTGYSLLSATASAVIAIILLPFFRKQLSVIKKPFHAVGTAIFNGIIAQFASLLLVIALTRGLPASAQYPMVTGGVMIGSTVIALFSKRKPSKKEILSVALSFIGILALVLIPV